jgi:hypothetical protein
VKYNTEIQPAGWASPVVLGPNGSVLYAGGASTSQSTYARTAIPLNVAAFGSMNLTASLGVSVHNAVGQLPRSAMGAVSPVDPAANQAKTTWGTSPQAAAAVPAWGTGAPAAATGTSLQRGTTLNRGSTFKSQQQMAPVTVAAPSTLQAP